MVFSVSGRFLNRFSAKKKTRLKCGKLRPETVSRADLLASFTRPSDLSTCAAAAKPLFSVVCVTCVTMLRSAGWNMPKSARKARSTQTSISSYFGGPSSGRPRISAGTGEPRLRRGKVRCGQSLIKRWGFTSVNAHHGTLSCSRNCPVTRIWVCHQNELSLVYSKCPRRIWALKVSVSATLVWGHWVPLGCVIYRRGSVSSETRPTLNKGAVGLCSSTLEKLRGFTCLAEPSDSEGVEDKLDGGISESCEQGGGTSNPRGVKDPPSNKTRLQDTEEQDSWRVSPTQVNTVSHVTL